MISSGVTDGYYNINFDAAPEELYDIDSVFIRYSAVVFLDRESLYLSAVTSSLNGFNPLNSDIDTLEASFSHNEGAYITAEVFDENLTTVRTLFPHSTWRPVSIT